MMSWTTVRDVTRLTKNEVELPRVVHLFIGNRGRQVAHEDRLRVLPVGVAHLADAKPEPRVRDLKEHEVNTCKRVL
eukprot:1192377-Prorocentrum_minimum.AAC.2